MDSRVENVFPQTVLTTRPTATTMICGGVMAVSKKSLVPPHQTTPRTVLQTPLSTTSICSIVTSLLPPSRRRRASSTVIPETSSTSGWSKRRSQELPGRQVPTITSEPSGVCRVLEDAAVGQETASSQNLSFGPGRDGKDPTKLRIATRVGRPSRMINSNKTMSSLSKAVTSPKKFTDKQQRIKKAED